MRYRSTVTSKEDGQVGSFEYVWVDGKLISIVFISDGSTSTAKYLYNDFEEPVGMIVTDDDGTLSTYYYLKNAQGDITNIVNASGRKLIEFTYDAFGNQTVHYQADSSTIIGMLDLVEQVMVHSLTPFGYRGYCYDVYSGLYYLQSRYYDPQTGRFINADDTNYLNATGTVLGCNLFAYCENDAVNFVDPSGCYKDYAFTIIPNMSATNIIYSISKKVQATGVTTLRANTCYVPISGKKYYTYNADVSWIASNSAIYVKYSNFQDRYAMYPYYYTTYYHKKTYNEWLYYIAQRHITVFDVIQEQVMSTLNMDYSDWDSATYAMGEVTYSEKLKFVSDILFYYEFLSLVTKLLTQWFDKVDNYIMEILKRRPKLENSSWQIAIMWSVSYYRYGYFNSGTGYRRAWHLTKTYYAWEL